MERPVREQRLATVLKAHMHMIGRTLRAYGVPERELDDAIQKVCIVVSDKLDRIEVRAERSFVYKTAHRIAYRCRRTQGRRREVLDDDNATVEVCATNPEQLLDERQALDVVSTILDTFDEELKEVFVLYELEEFTMSEIASVLDIPAGTVASRLRRARAKFEHLAQKFRDTEGAGR